MAAIFYLVIYFFVFVSPEQASVSCGRNIYYNLQAFLATLKVIGEYVVLLFIPFGVTFLPFEYYLIKYSIFRWDIVSPTILIILTIIIAIKSFKYSKHISFGIFWFYISILPVTNIIPIINPKAFRYLYLPSIGFCILLSFISRNLGSLKKIKSYFPHFKEILAILIIIAYIFLALPQNLFWKNDFVFSAELLYYDPHDAAALTVQGDWYCMMGLSYMALLHYRAALKIDPNAGLHNAIGYCYANLDNEDKAIEEFKKAIELKPSLALASINLGLIYLDKKDYDKSIEYFQKAIETDPMAINAYNGLAAVYVELKQFKKAEETLYRALKVFPDFELAQENLNIVEEIKKSGISDDKKIKYELKL